MSANTIYNLFHGKIDKKIDFLQFQEQFFEAIELLMIGFVI
ncbi:hypothetical protein MTBBW1_2030039 [Desulfamplus magnetovallimortis]|uniref:Uncharacterized protein n=1 Tax=Desulfamplus magnetovallimortis TaxID=1246637 RepID=A0A1W1HBX8_9BACT|nr:hypothetical protein MTBBW1_2030039 [Desulfamplus magnetovallimortis]